MRQIRKNVFETNSSSSHSLVIKKGVDEYLTQEELEDSHIGWEAEHGGIWEPWEDLYFGRSPFQVLVSFDDKVRYAYANLIDWNWNEEFDKNEYIIPEELETLLGELLPGYQGIKIPDNCSIGTDEPYLRGWMKKYNISLREFLTNKRYIVICDGDEYCIWDDLRDSGLIDSNAIEHDSELEAKIAWEQKFKEEYEENNSETD